MKSPEAEHELPQDEKILRDFFIGGCYVIKEFKTNLEVNDAFSNFRRILRSLTLFYSFDYCIYAMYIVLSFLKNEAFGKHFFHLGDHDLNGV